MNSNSNNNNNNIDVIYTKLVKLVLFSKLLLNNGSCAKSLFTS